MSIASRFAHELDYQQLIEGMIHVNLIVTVLALDNNHSYPSDFESNRNILLSINHKLTHNLMIRNSYYNDLKLRKIWLDYSIGSVNSFNERIGKHAIA